VNPGEHVTVQANELVDGKPLRAILKKMSKRGRIARVDLLPIPQVERWRRVVWDMSSLPHGIDLKVRTDSESFTGVLAAGYGAHLSIRDITF
jgi:hypothetical protein